MRIASKAGGDIQIQICVRGKFALNDIVKIGGSQLRPRQLSVIVRILQIHKEPAREVARIHRVITHIQLQEEEFPGCVQSRNGGAEVEFQLRVIHPAFRIQIESVALVEAKAELEVE